MANVNGTPIKKYYKILVNGEWRIIYFNTDASAVAETSGRKFLTSEQQSWLSTHLAGLTIKLNNGVPYEYDPVNGGYEQTVYGGLFVQPEDPFIYLCMQAVDQDIQTDLADNTDFIRIGLKDENAVLMKSDYTGQDGKILSNKLPSTVMYTGDYVDSSTQKILLSKLPDAVLGQVIFGGVFGPTEGAGAVVEGTSTTGGAYFICDRVALSIRQRLNIPLDAAINPKFWIGYKGSADSYNYSPADCEGIFFISNVNKTFYYKTASTDSEVKSLTVEKGDWIISNGTAWERVDNSDAVRTVNGHLGDVSILIDTSAVNATVTELQSSNKGDIIYHKSQSYVRTATAIPSGISASIYNDLENLGDYLCDPSNGLTHPLGKIYAVGTTSVAGLTKLYTTLGSNTDGTIRQDVLTQQIYSCKTYISDNEPSNVAEGSIWLDTSTGISQA